MDPGIIQALYRASCAGVAVQLIVRGVCALRPGVPGVSENITVRSLVGRFLEHSRVYWFENGGRNQLLLASADWMERNFFRRIEVAFPVLRARLRSQLREDLEECIADDCNAWLLQSDGSYVRAAGSVPPACDAQAAQLLRYASAGRDPA